MTIERSAAIRYLAMALVGAGLVFAATQTLNAYLLSVIQFAGINIILAVSLNITNGFAGLFSLGHPAFMAIGGYVAAILTFPVARKSLMLPDLPPWLAGQHWPFPLALTAGGLVAAATALLVGFPVLRLRGHYLAVATLGFIFIVQSLATNLDGYTRGALGLNGLLELTSLWWVYGWMLLTLYVCWQLKHSSLGRTFLAMRENELAASCLGVPITRMRLLSFTLGAFFAGVAGGLWAHLVTLITPTSFSILLAFQLVVIVVIGGTGSIAGAVIVATILTATGEILRPVEEAVGLYGADQMLVAVAVLLVLIYRPKGLFGTAEPGFLRWGRRPSGAN